jgi:sulfite reductase (ferredoxin)
VYRDLGEQVGDLGPKDTTAASAAAKMAFAKTFLDVCRTATEQMGKDLKLAQVTQGAEPAAPVAESRQAGSSAGTSPVALSRPSEAPVYDLRGVACPMNYVKTKLKLEMMEAGEKLEVWLDAGEPIRNVPMSLRNDGHKIMREGPLDAEEKHFTILVEKVEG